MILIKYNWRELDNPFDNDNRLRRVLTLSIICKMQCTYLLTVCSTNKDSLLTQQCSDLFIANQLNQASILQTSDIMKFLFYFTHMHVFVYVPTSSMICCMFLYPFLYFCMCESVNNTSVEANLYCIVAMKLSFLMFFCNF